MELILITPSYSPLNHSPPFTPHFAPGLSLSFSFTIRPWFLGVSSFSSSSPSPFCIHPNSPRLFLLRPLPLSNSWQWMERPPRGCRRRLTFTNTYVCARH